MKIVHFLSALDRGGAQRMVAVLSEEQAKQHTVEIWLKCDKPHAFAVASSVRVRELSETGCLSFVDTVRTLKTMLSREYIDVIVAHTNRNTEPAIIASRLAGVPIVAMEHTVYAGLQSRAWRLLRLLTYPFASAVVVLSADQTEKYPWSRVRVIPNPIEDQFREARASRRGVGDQLRVVFVGRLESVKGPDRLLDICRHLSFPYHIDILGSGSQETQLRNLVDRTGMSSKVSFHGWKSDVTAFFDSADAIAITSRKEGFGLVAVEAMARGCLPVAYDVEGGLKDIIADGKDGFLVDDGDAYAFAMRLKQIWDNRDRVDEMRTASKTKSSRFSVVEISRRWDQLLGTIVQERPRR